MGEAVALTRKGEDWITDVASDQAARRMPEIGVEIPMAETYADIDLAPGQEPVPARG